MTTLPKLPYGHPEFRLRAAGLCAQLITLSFTDFGLHRATIDTKTWEVDLPLPDPDEDEDENEDDTNTVAVFLDDAGGCEGVEEILRYLGADVIPETHGWLVRYFEGIAEVAHGLECGDSLIVAQKELLRLQDQLDRMLG
jgi:hypothetical protein